MGHQFLKDLKITIDARMINASGIGRYIKALMPALINNFNSVTLLGIPADINKFEWSGKVQIIEVKAPIYSVSEQFEILRKTPACDIFMAPHYNAPVWLPQAKKVAVIIPDANHLVFGKEMSLIKRLYAKFFYAVSVKKDILFTISDFSRSEISRFTKIDLASLKVAKCAIDKDYFNNIQFQMEAGNFPPQIEQIKNLDYILFTGNVKPHKNLKRCLLAFEKISDAYPNLKFLIVGKKDNFISGDKAVFELVENSPILKEGVVFTGHLSDMELAYLYKNAKLFLFPSLYEGFGIPPLEAMFFGCPVIVSREGSLPEICGNAAYFCNAYDVDDIASSIIEMLSNSTLRKDLIAKGFVKVNEYDWKYFNSTIINGLTIK